MIYIDILLRIILIQLCHPKGSRRRKAIANPLNACNQPTSDNEARQPTLGNPLCTQSNLSDIPLYYLFADFHFWMGSYCKL